LEIYLIMRVKLSEKFKDEREEERYKFYEKKSKNGEKYFRVEDTKHNYFFDTSIHHLKNPSPYFIRYEDKLYFKKRMFNINCFVYNTQFPNEGYTIEFDDIHNNLLKQENTGLRISFGYFSCEYTLVYMSNVTNIIDAYPNLCVNFPRDFIKNNKELFIQIKERKCLTQDLEGHFGSCEFRFIPIHKFESHTKKIYNRYAELYNSICE